MAYNNVDRPHWPIVMSMWPTVRPMWHTNVRPMWPTRLGGHIGIKLLRLHWPKLGHIDIH